MDLNLRDRISQFVSCFQRELIPLVQSDVGELITAPMQKLLRIWEMVTIERFVPSSRGWVGRPPRERAAVARAFVAKTVLNLPTTVALIERLKVDPVLRRLCGFDMRKELPGEHLFSRAFAEFSAQGLASQVHEDLIHRYLSDQIIVHVARDSTEIEAREKPLKNTQAQPTEASSPAQNSSPPPAQGSLPLSAEVSISGPLEGNPLPPAEASPPEPLQGSLPLPVQASPPQPVQAPVKRKPGRPRKGEEPPPPAPTVIERQAAGMSLQEMLAQLPTACDVGCKKNSKGYKETWIGYKLHWDVGDGQIPISAVVTSASVHDSQVSIPLAKITAERVENLYDLMDSAYCSSTMRQYSRDMGHLPLIDHNPRRGEKNDFTPLEAERYKNRTQVERANARLKDEFGARYVRVRGHAKVSMHLMLGVVVLAADQLLRLIA